MTDYISMRFLIDGSLSPPIELGRHTTKGFVGILYNTNNREHILFVKATEMSNHIEDYGPYSWQELAQDALDGKFLPNVQRMPSHIQIRWNV